MSNSIVIGFEEAKTINWAAIGNGYDPVTDSTGNAYFENPCRMLYINNMTNAVLWVSDTGVVDKFSVAANTAMILDITTNKTVTQGCFLAEKTRIFVRARYAGVFPTSGDVDVTVIYGKDN